MQRVVAEEEKGVKIHFDVSFFNTFQFAHTTIIAHITEPSYRNERYDSVSR